MLSPWQAKHEDGSDDEDDVEGGEPDQKAVDRALHLWPVYKCVNDKFFICGLYISFG